MDTGRIVCMFINQKKTVEKISTMAECTFLIGQNLNQRADGHFSDGATTKVSRIL